MISFPKIKDIFKKEKPINYDIGDFFCIVAGIVALGLGIWFMSIYITS